MKRLLGLTLGAILALSMSALPSAGADTGIGAAAVPPATTAGQCNFGCSETDNTSQFPVLIGRNWCWSESWEEAPGDALRNCTSGGVIQGSMWIPGGNGGSPDGQDWDTFRVDGGWCYTGSMLSWPGPWQTPFRYDRRGANGLWVRVHNNELAIVTGQTSGNC
jgi:hypothetical protein